jgi:hypothetical protein
MSDRIDAVYEMMQHWNREWMKINGPRANGPMIQEAGRKCFREVVGPFIRDIDAIDTLRREEGNVVTIPCDNPEGDCAVDVAADWTDWKERRFTGRTVSDALAAAVVSMPAKCLTPRMCGCPACVEKYGPIHPGNIGKPRPSSGQPALSRLA